MDDVPPPPPDLLAEGSSSSSGSDSGSDSEDDVPLRMRRGRFLSPQRVVPAVPEPTEVPRRVLEPPLPTPTEAPMPALEAPIPRPTTGGKGFQIRPSARHQRRSRQTGNIKVVSKPAVRRLARRGGVKRMSSEIYTETQNVAKEFLVKVLEKSCIYMKDRNSSAKTLNPGDVVRALHNMGLPMYGFGR
jgi:histone H4